MPYPKRCRYQRWTLAWFLDVQTHRQAAHGLLRPGHDGVLGFLAEVAGIEVDEVVVVDVLPRRLAVGGVPDGLGHAACPQVPAGQIQLGHPLQALPEHGVAAEQGEQTVAMAVGRRRAHAAAACWTPFSSSSRPSARAGMLRVQRGWLTGSRNASGCGISPNTRPLASHRPAAAAVEPLGFSG